MHFRIQPIEVEHDDYWLNARARAYVSMSKKTNDCDHTGELVDQKYSSIPPYPGEEQKD